MTIPLSPQITLSPNSFSSGGTQITAAVSVMNRPAYHGKPKITGLTTITPKIICSRTPTGSIPFFVMVSASETTADAGNPYRDLHFEWDFGDSGGTEEFTDHWNGQTVNANNCQQGGEAGYCYRSAGAYTITLTVKGKDENGNLITASTTSIMTMGSHYTFLGLATGGTFTYTFNGQTTSAIAFDATAATRLAALHALSNLDATNCRLSAMQNIELFGDLLGTSYTFTMDTTSLTGVTGTVQFRTDKPSATLTEVTVSDLSSGWSAQYFDPTYDGSNGAPNGTESRPYTTAAQFLSHVGNSGGSTVNNRVGYLKRGTSLTIGAMEHSRSEKGIRVLPYSTGADPILTVTGQYKIEISWDTTNSGAGGDIVFSEIDIRTSMGLAWCRPVTSNNGTTTKAFSRVTDVLLDSCTFTHSGALETSGEFVAIAMSQSGRGINMHGMYLWQCDMVMGSSGSNVLFFLMEQWAGVWGGSCSGGHYLTGRSNLDHHFYPDVHHHTVFAHINFGTGDKSYCINQNAVNDQGAAQYHLITGCNITGTSNGIDLANSNNDEALSGRFEDTVIQFNRIHLDKVGTNGLAISIINCHNLTIRDNDIYGATNTGLQVKDAICDFSIYRNRFYKARMLTYGDVTGYLHDNAFYHDYNNEPAINFLGNTATTSQSWDVDGNSWYAVGSSQPINNTSLATWQGYGNDLNGSYADPGWDDPANGVFIADPTVAVNWPNGFTDLEYSTDDGGSWSAYVDDAALSLGTGLESRTVVLFRAKTPALNGVFPVAVTSDSSSVEIAAETDSGNLTGDGVLLYLCIQVGGSVLVLSQEA